MHFKSELNIGDIAFVWDDINKISMPVTIGQIRIKHTDSPGRGDPDEIFDNYKPLKAYEEDYMCIETGIDSGRLYTYNLHIFKTSKECADAFTTKGKNYAKKTI